MTRRLILIASMLLWAASALAADNCGVWAMKRNDLYARKYNGDQNGFNSALAYINNVGFISINPGCETQITIPAQLSDSVLILRYEGGTARVHGKLWNFFQRGAERARVDSLGLMILGTVRTPRLGPASSPNSGGAIRIIDGNTFTFDNTGVQAAVDEVTRAGGGLVYMPAGRYRFVTNVNIDSAAVVVQGAGDSTVVFSDAATGDDCFRITSTAGNCVIRDMRIDGLQATNSAGRGIDVEGGAGGNLIENVTVLNTNDAGIAVGAKATVVRGCRVWGIGDAIAGDRRGIMVYGSADSCRIEDNDIRDAKDEGINIGDDCDYTIVKNNRVRESLSGAIRFTPTSGKHGIVEGNLFDGSTNSVLAWFGGDSLRIVNNTFTRGKIYSGLYLLRGTSVLIANNICSFNVHHGIYVGYDQGNCKDVVITGNICTGNQGSGIIIDPSTTRTFTNIVVTGNTCIGNTSYGITTSAASFASTAYIGNNVLISNTAGAASLNATNWTYGAPRFEALTVSSTGTFTKSGTLGDVNIGTGANILEFTYGGSNIIRASDAAGELRFQTGGTTSRLTISSAGVTTLSGATTLTNVTSATVANTGAIKFNDTGGTARNALWTAGGTDILRLSPLASGASIDVLNYAGTANVTFRDDGVFVLKGIAFASLPSATGKNGGILYCTDCKGPADAGWSAGMAAAASGTGAVVAGLNGAWRTLP